MSLKARIRRLERQDESHWEAPFFITLDDDDAPRVDALRKQYREEIKRDRARGRVLFGVDFRP